jgi:hypothetical protein
MRSILKHIAIGLIALIMCSLLLAPWHVSRADHLANRVLRGGFDVIIYEGPSAQIAPVLLAGVLTVKVDPSGGFTGALTPFSGQSSVAFGGLAVSDPHSVPVAGQITGRAYSMVMDLGNGKHIFGTGAALNDLSRELNVGLVGGPAVGPETGDRGDWASPVQTTDPRNIDTILSISSNTAAQGQLANSFGYIPAALPAPSNAQ